MAALRRSVFVTARGLAQPGREIPRVGAFGESVSAFSGVDSVAEVSARGAF